MSFSCSSAQSDPGCCVTLSVVINNSHKRRNLLIPLDLRERFCPSHVVLTVQDDRGGSSVDAAQVLGEGNASLVLSKVKAKDEGTYICTIGVGALSAQQVVQLHVYRKRHSQSDVFSVFPFVKLFVFPFRSAAGFSPREAGEVRVSADAELPL